MIAALLLIGSLIATVGAQNTPTITSITGCNPSGNQTIGCSLSQSITIYGSYLDARQALVTVNNTMCTNPWNPYQSIAQVSDPSTGETLGPYSQLVCTLAPSSSQGLASNQLLPVTVSNLVDNLISEPANLISFAPIIAPRVDYVVGCGMSNTSDSLCDVTSSIITVVGDGFLQDNSYYSLSFGSTQFYLNQHFLYLGSSQGCFNIINSTAMSFCLNFTQYYTPLPNTGKLTFFLSHGNLMSTNNFTVWFNTSTASRIANPPLVRPVQSITITGVSGCVNQVSEMYFDSLNRTVNVTTTSGCIKPAEFVLTGYNFTRFGLIITVGNERCYQFSTNSNRSTITCQVMEGFSNIPHGQTLPVVIYDVFNNVQSNSFYGVTFADQAVPIIDGITGCDDQSLDSTNNQPTTLNCDPSASVTLSGSNFASQGQTFSVITAIPNQYSVISLALPTGSLLDDSNIVVPLSIFSSYMSPIMSSNKTLSLCLKVGNNQPLVSNCVRFQFAQPVMSITSLNGCTPVYSNNQSRTSFELVNCFAGTSMLTITGNNLYEPLVVSVGGVTCAKQYVYTTGFQCQLPAIPDFVPGFAYDLSIYQSSSSSTITLPGAITFAIRPTISSITSQFCPPDSRSSYPTLKCDSGDVLTIFGSFFNESSVLNVMMTTVDSRQTVKCLNTTVVSDDQLICVLPSLDLTTRALMSNQYINLRVQDNTTGVDSNVVTSLIYRSLSDPAIYEVMGCASNNLMDRSATGCVTTNIITINGINFNALFGSQSTQGPSLSMYDVETSGYYSALNVTVVNATQIRAVLPYIHRSSSIDLMALQLTIPQRNYGRSNWFYGVEYSSELPTNTTTTIIIEQQILVQSTSYETAYIVALAVLVPITFMLFVLFVVATYALHKLRKSQQQPISEDRVIDSDASMGKYDRHNDIEMSHNQMS